MLTIFAALLLAAAPARAVLDNADKGPVLSAGDFVMRVTNAGILGNAFFNRGLSFDPSFECPRGSGHEAMNHAELWVGARNAAGRVRVSGGPMLEWRPTLDPDDRVLTGWTGRPGSRRGVDDDGDGRVDEEVLNGKDDDGDGEVDEDMGFPAQEVLAAEYTDMQPEAVNYAYPTGESHEPLGLAVHQEAYAWSVPGYDKIAGVEFTVTNRGSQRLEQLYLGLYCDLDSRLRVEPGGHMDDEVVWLPVAVTIPEGLSRTQAGEWYRKTCFTDVRRLVPVVKDSKTGSGLPLSAVIPLRHTTDPLGYITNTVFPGVAELADKVRAPVVDTTFRYSVYFQDLPQGQGGPPILDADRYEALRGRFPQPPPGHVGDAAVLLSCGPFRFLEPGQSLSFAVAFAAADDPDSLVMELVNAIVMHHGQRVNLIADELGADSTFYTRGVSGRNGHEVCLEPPEGMVFYYDPHCPVKFNHELVDSCEGRMCYGQCCMPATSAFEVRYEHGHCVWTDADCDLCTGFEGKETRLWWLDPGTVPPAPSYRSVRGDHQVTVEWDNLPELQLAAGVAGTPGYRFAGYRVYRLSDWTRETILPPPRSWQLVGAFGVDTLQMEQPLAAVTDSAVDYDYIRYEKKHYPVGRYRLVDREVLNGFDYLYVVTTVSRLVVAQGSRFDVREMETPLVASIDSVVVPHTTARGGAGQVWVVPNPYRAHAPWDRPPVPGDPFGRHVDFMGLPRARCTIRIYTVAGDYVAQVEHDGRNGDGQAPWNLISRNGQDIESGIYLFTVESALGKSTGRFVIIR